MSKSFGQSFRIDKSHNILAMKVFCSWDFKVIKKTSVNIMSENICTQLKVRTSSPFSRSSWCSGGMQWSNNAFLSVLYALVQLSFIKTPVFFFFCIVTLQELLAEVNHKDVKNTLCQKLWRLMVHGLAWAICIAVTAACVIGIYFLSHYMHKVRLVRVQMSYAVIETWLSWSWSSGLLGG